MIPRDRIKKIISSYKSPTIATICSHSALQIFAGAKEEGFKTLGICTKDRLDTSGQQQKKGWSWTELSTNTTQGIS